MKPPQFTREITAGIVAGLLTPVILIVVAFVGSHHAERYWLLIAGLAIALGVNGYLLHDRPRRFLGRQAFMAANLKAIEAENERYRPAQCHT